MAITKKPSARTHTPPGDYKRARPDMAAPPSGEWFAIVANVNAERKAARALDPLWGDLDEDDRARAMPSPFRVYLPMFARLSLVGGRKREKAVIQRPVFPRYVFTSSRSGAFPFFLLRGVNGVESIVRCEGRPLAIPHGIIAEIMRRDDAGAFDLTKLNQIKTLADAGYEADEMVRILLGPFEGLHAKIKAMMPGGKARVMLDIFGRQTFAEFPLAGLAKSA
jgi:transcription antitermination factor NusG